MFSNPVKTGVVILGASEFDHSADSNRQVFANAAAEAVRYFCDDIRGLGIPLENILNLFNSPTSAPEQNREILDFVQ